MMPRNEFNFYHPTHTQRTINRLFYPDADDGPYVPLVDGWTMAHVMHAAGLFPSVSQARKNGWDKPIPEGWSEYTVGKLRKRVFVYNWPEPELCTSACKDCLGTRCSFRPLDPGEVNAKKIDA